MREKKLFACIRRRHKCYKPNKADSKLVCYALNNAIRQRNQSDYLLFHSDRGSQYSSDEFQDLLLSNGIESSMSLAGDPWSNAVQENFFQKLKHEFIRGKKFANLEEVRKEVFEYIEVFYNMRRSQKDLGYISSNEYEKEHEVVA